MDLALPRPCLAVPPASFISRQFVLDAGNGMTIEIPKVDADSLVMVTFFCECMLAAPGQAPRIDIFRIASLAGENARRIASADFPVHFNRLAHWNEDPKQVSSSASTAANYALRAGDATEYLRFNLIRAPVNLTGSLISVARLQVTLPPRPTP